eukprot:4634-Heterococcus_DN1.PRE.1
MAIFEQYVRMRSIHAQFKEQSRRVHAYRRGMRHTVNDSVCSTDVVVALRSPAKLISLHNVYVNVPDRSS